MGGGRAIMPPPILDRVNPSNSVVKQNSKTDTGTLILFTCYALFPLDLNGIVSDGEAELLSVIILQLNYPNLHN